MILLIVLGLSIYGMFMWVSIKLTDDVFVADRWYWQILSFGLGIILACIEFLLIMIGIAVLIMDHTSNF
jgi:uncharacterized membrane protein